MVEYINKNCLQRIAYIQDNGTSKMKTADGKQFVVKFSEYKALTSFIFYTYLIEFDSNLVPKQFLVIDAGECIDNKSGVLNEKNSPIVGVASEYIHSFIVNARLYSHESNDTLGCHTPLGSSFNEGCPYGTINDDDVHLKSSVNSCLVSKITNFCTNDDGRGLYKLNGKLCPIIVDIDLEGFTFYSKDFSGAKIKGNYKIHNYIYKDYIGEYLFKYMCPLIVIKNNGQHATTLTYELYKDAVNNFIEIFTNQKLDALATLTLATFQNDKGEWRIQNSEISDVDEMTEIQRLVKGYTESIKEHREYLQKEYLKFLDRVEEVDYNHVEDL